MSKLETYLGTLRESELQNGARQSAKEFTALVLDKFDHMSRTNGLLFGEVQSGKTSHTFACLAATADADEAFATFVYLVSNSNSLQEQTRDRAMAQLDEVFAVCDEKEHGTRFVNAKRRPRLAVIKKEVNALRAWVDAIRKDERSNLGPIFIVDDEADAASPNTKINSDEESTTFALVNELRSLGTSSIFLQVTATPQSLLLQEQGTELRPQFAFAFKPGSQYIGGDFFFGVDNARQTSRIPEDDLEQLLDLDIKEPSVGLRQAVAHFLVARALFMREGRANINANIHPSISKDAHFRLEHWVKRLLVDYAEPALDPVYEAALRSQIDNLNSGLSSHDPISAEDVRKSLKTIDQINVVTLNSDTIPDDKKLSEGANVIIGGNALSRGVTFENLQTVYYTRSSRIKNADTFWQHARIFGYSRHKETVRIFMPGSLISLFSILQSTQRRLVDSISTGDYKNVSLIFPQGHGVRPTRLNVLDKSTYGVIVGGVDYFPPTPYQGNLEAVDDLLEMFSSDNPEPISSELVVDLLKLSSRSDDFPRNKFISAVKSISGTSAVEFWLLKRLERNIASGTGTMLSESDRKLGKSEEFSDHVFITCYRVLGGLDKSWDGSPFWLMNIQLPKNYVFHQSD
ncbi:MAG: Z1 domain-containing protein [Aquiluna sp.]|nr:Z1 domain-containing protein [Aquiluna sp.]